MPGTLGGVDFLGIAGYRPQWLVGIRALAAAHGARLGGLVGRRLDRVWLLEDEDGEWFADAPVLLDFGGDLLEVCHNKLWDLSLTWNTVDPGRDVVPPWLEGVRLHWREDLVDWVTHAHGCRLQEAALLEYTRDDMASGMVAPYFDFGATLLTIYNGLDENALTSSAPGPTYRRHSVY